MTFKVTSLRYNNTIIGLRFYTEKAIYDADKASLRKHGIFTLATPLIEDILPINNQLMTQSEYDNNLQIEDISTNTTLLTTLTNLVRQHPEYHILTKFLLPYEQSLQSFLRAGYKVERHQRNDEHNGQHSMYLPDGTIYRGGWIGKARTPEQALANHHYESCYWAIHREIVPSPTALQGYPDLVAYEKAIRHIMEQIVVTDTPSDLVLTLPAKRKAPPVDFRESGGFFRKSRIEQRGSVKGVYLPTLDPATTMFPPPPKTNPYLTQGVSELTIIALMRRYREIRGIKPKDVYHPPQQT